MGGYVSHATMRETRLPDTDALAPPNAYVVTDYLSLSGVPFANAHLAALHTLWRVCDVVTLTLTPLTTARLFNCNAESTEWTDPRDDGTEFPNTVGGNVRFHHVPLLDGGVPCGRQLMHVVELCRAARDAGTRVHVHCWKGSKRSWTMACAVIMALDGVCVSEATCRMSRRMMGDLTAQEKAYLASSNVRFPNAVGQEDFPQEMAVILGSIPGITPAFEVGRGPVSRLDKIQQCKRDWADITRAVVGTVDTGEVPAIPLHGGAADDD